MIYLDSAATTPISDEVLSAMTPYLTTHYGNPNSVYPLGTEARKAISAARQQVADAIGAEPNQIIFTSGGSEANNLAIQGFCKSHNAGIIFSKTEHTSSINASSIIHNTLYLEEHFDDDDQNCKELESYKGADALVWRMYVNNEIGKVNNVCKIGGVCRSNDHLYFGTDCVQALGFERINIKEIGCDFATFSAHKIHGPKGVGALYVKDKNMIEPLIYGGISQEFGLRGGTENVAGIVGFGKACEIAEKNREYNRKKILYLRHLFLEMIDGMEYKLNCDDESKIISLTIPGVDAETFVVAMYASYGIAISSGSACRNNELIANEALIQYGLTVQNARETVRLSLSENLSDVDIQVVANSCKEIIKILK